MTFHKWLEDNTLYAILFVILMGPLGLLISYLIYLDEKETAEQQTTTEEIPTQNNTETVGEKNE